ncbi:MAG: sulfotransferase domain-containing protein [Pseudomonadota bacterium]
MGAVVLPAAYRRKVRADTWSNFSVLRHGAFDGMLVTSKNSGTHWIKYMLAVALAEEYRLPPPTYFSENAVRPYIGWPKDAATFEVLPRLAFSHTIPHALMDWGWARSLAHLPKYVLAVRHPMSILASHYAKWSHELQVDWLTYLRGDPAGSRYRCDIYWMARFWNRWGEILSRDPDRFHILPYESSLKDPAAALRSVLSHWEIEVGDSAIGHAVQAGAKSEMAKRVDPDAERNVLQDRRDKLSDLFSEEALEIYLGQVKALFSHDLGYDLEAFPS